MALAEALPETEPESDSERAPGPPVVAARVALAQVRQRAEALVLARDRVLPVSPPLAALLPEGLRRGVTVAVAGGPGATSLALALVAGPSAAGSWVATTSASLGLLAALEHGVVAARLLVVPGVPPASLGTVLAALIDAVDVVLVGRSPAASACRRLTARARERGSVLVVLPGAGQWGQAPDVVLTAGASIWGAPAGRLASRRLTVTTSGRGPAARPRHAEVQLPGPTGAATAVEL